MLTGKDLILATKEFAKEDRAKSWFHTLFALIILILSHTGTYWTSHIVAKIFCSILSGFMIVRMFVIYHDYQHGAILAKSRIADIIMTIFGLYILAPKSIWKRSHDYHHKNNSKLFSASIGSYPIMTKEKFYNSSKGARYTYLFVRHPLTIVFGYLTMFMYGMCLNSFLSSPKRHLDSLLAIGIHVTVVGLLLYFGGWEVLLLSWIIPFAIPCSLGSYLFYAQHNFPGVTFKNNVEWSYDHAALESSSFMKMNPIMRWFTANIGYHHIHHMNARIPFYRLPEVMEKIPELQSPKITSLKIKDIRECFKLKVWDPAQNKMTGI